MRFFRFQMNTSDRPDRQTVDQFLQVVNDPANQPVFVHCHGGRHRTGVMTAIYRLNHYSWTADQAYGEMMRYEFGKGFGHGALKDYVYEYRANLEKQNIAAGEQDAKAGASAKGDLSRRMQLARGNTTAEISFREWVADTATYSDRPLLCEVNQLVDSRV